MLASLSLEGLARITVSPVLPALTYFDITIFYVIQTRPHLTSDEKRKSIKRGDEIGLKLILINILLYILVYVERISHPLN